MNFHWFVIIAELWRPEIARGWKKSICLRFGENDTLRQNFPNFVPQGFIATPIDVLCSNYVKFGRRKIGKSCVIYLTKKQNFACLSSSRFCADLRGPAPRMYSERSRFHPNRFTFSCVIAERVNTIRELSKVNPIFGWSLASSRIITRSAYNFAFVLSSAVSKHRKEFTTNLRQFWIG